VRESISTLDLVRPTHTKIVATLGPASEPPEMLDKLIAAGVSIFRLNFSHGDLEAHALRLHAIRAAAQRAQRPVAILGDLQGPKLRVTLVPDLSPDGGYMAETGTDVIFRRDVAEAFLDPATRTPVFGSTFDPLFRDVLPGQRVLINDGAVRMLAVEQIPGQELRCRVTFGGRISSKKGINLPESDLDVPAITPRDWQCAEWAIKHGIDFLALSFVRSAREIIELKERIASICAADRTIHDASIGHEIPIIAKIEKPQAVANIDEIVQAVDGIMVARGDLGVEMDVAYVPVAQRLIINKCHEYGKPVIVATQMLESMIESATPTRAEATDVAGAVFQGADAVMLSGETAVGRHPALVVETMRRIIAVTEKSIVESQGEFAPAPKLEELPYRSAALARGAWHIAREANAKVVVVWSENGGMARYLSRSDFKIPIIAFSSSEVATRRMILFSNVNPVCSAPPTTGTLAEWTDAVEAHLREHALASDGDVAILIAGKPLGGSRAQDLLAMLRIGDRNSGFRAHDHESPRERRG
jgi:pyruvate kinase